MQPMLITSLDSQTLRALHDEAAPPVDEERLHTTFAALTAFAMTTIALAAGFAVLL